MHKIETFADLANYVGDTLRAVTQRVILLAMNIQYYRKYRRQTPHNGRGTRTPRPSAFAASSGLLGQRARRPKKRRFHFQVSKSADVGGASSTQQVLTLPALLVFERRCLVFWTCWTPDFRDLKTCRLQ